MIRDGTIDLVDEPKCGVPLVSAEFRRTARRLGPRNLETHLPLRDLGQATPYNGFGYKQYLDAQCS